MLSPDEILDLELQFVRYCYDNGLDPRNIKEILLHQKAFFNGVLKGFYYKKVESKPVTKWIEAISNREWIIPRKEFEQLTLEVVNDIAQAKIHLDTIRRIERRRKKELKEANDIDKW